MGIPIFWNRTEYILTQPDEYTDFYKFRTDAVRTMVDYLIKRGYVIFGLSRSSDGDSHSVSAETEMYVIGNGRHQDHIIKAHENRLNYLATTPDIIKVDSLTEDILDDWCNEFDTGGLGEAFNYRTIWYRYGEGGDYYKGVFRTSFNHNPDAPEYKGKQLIIFVEGDRQSLGPDDRLLDIINDRFGIPRYRLKYNRVDYSGVSGWNCHVNKVEKKFFIGDTGNILETDGMGFLDEVIQLYKEKYGED